MDLPESEMARLYQAGGEALIFNAPLGSSRAQALVEWLSRGNPTRAVDLGCGSGELARLLAARATSTGVVGVDTDEGAISGATERASSSSLSGRLHYEVADASAWEGPTDAAICVGASHAFGGPAEMLARLAYLLPTGAAVVGDGVWQAEPDAWCHETFGELPDGLEELISMAVASGWVVEAADMSSLDEWDEFETPWTRGVRSVGSTEALSFAAQRQADYQRYRGILGFGWLQLRR